ncbi:YicC/YloC family endoribonuclease [Actibacterium atlanticum]|nr:YicC/YloC family endoribonuclease [Actibacterium atlanticum]
MTGFAALSGAGQGYRWNWELRSVNGKGLDLRLRMPDWIAGLEQAVRADLGKAVGRGSVTLNLRVSRDEVSAATAIDEDALRANLNALAHIEQVAAAQGMQLAPTRAADILALRGVVQAASGEEDSAPLKAALLAELPKLISGFNEMRANEGAALNTVLMGHLTTIEDLVRQAMDAAEARKDAMSDTLRGNLARVMDNADGADADRVAQELALIAVKSDIREELDRLEAHVLAARALLGKSGPIGRKLDFLMQEFNREANTLCSKSQDSALTRIGLDLKATIDQMREQVQNVE